MGKGKTKEQSISVGAALSLSAINEDLSFLQSEGEQHKKTTDCVTDDDWRPANLYIYCDKSIAKVQVSLHFITTVSLLYYTRLFIILCHRFLFEM